MVSIWLRGFFDDCLAPDRFGRVWLEDHRLAPTGGPRLPSTLDRDSLLLGMVDVRRGSTSWFDEVFDPQVVAGHVFDPPREGEFLSVPALDSVWVGAHLTTLLVFEPNWSCSCRCDQRSILPERIALSDP